MFLLTGNQTYYYLITHPVKTDDIEIGKIKKFAVEEYFDGSRNCTFKITANDSVFFLKQPKNFDADRRITLKSESLFLSTINKLNLKDLQAKTTDFIYYDKQNSILWLKFIENLSILTDNDVANNFTSIPIALSKPLYNLHKSKALFFNLKSQLPKFIPYLLSITFNSLIFSLSESNKYQLNRLSKTLNNKKIKVFFRTLKKEWNYKSIIHNDLYAKNLCYNPKKSYEESLRILDWEMVSFGDALWDLATFCSTNYKTKNYDTSQGDSIGVDELTNFFIIKNLINNYNSQLSNKQKTKFLGLLAIKILSDYIINIENGMYDPILEKNLEVSLELLNRCDYFLTNIFIN